MSTLTLTPVQRAVVGGPVDRGRVFLEGASGCGKTTAGAARLLHLIDSGVPADSIAVIAPQRSLALPYAEALRRADLPPGGTPRLTTFSGIAREQVILYWPVIAERAGFAAASVAPTFLSLETAQYIMARVIDPLLDSGYFESVTLPRGRLYSQLLDNLNKAAINGFPTSEVAARLKAAWVGDSAQARVYDEVQEAISRFRETCLASNLLDYSLLIEVFMQHTLPVCRDRLFGTLPHLILDNIEEENPAATVFFDGWIRESTTALVIFDMDAGFRRFLGADEDAASDLRSACDQSVEFTDSLVQSADVRALTSELARGMDQFVENTEAGNPRAAFSLYAARFTPQMLDWAAEQASNLIASGVPAREIAILAPFMSDALRFSMIERLTTRGLRARSHRPSRSLRDEPVVRALITLAKLAHPAWGVAPDRADVTHALMAALSAGSSGPLDLTRAHLLTEAAYDPAARTLAPFESVPGDLQERLSYTVGEKYDHLRAWLAEYVSAQTLPPPAPVKPKRGRKKADSVPDVPPPPVDVPLDHCFSRLFGEVLSARGYGLYRDLIAADAIAALVESARGFRRTLERTGHDPAIPIGREYIAMLEAGVIANQYTAAWLRPDADAVLVAPAYTFLMDNRAIQHQIWLDVGGRGWSERVFQPLTHPVVLTRRWDGAVWDDEQERAYRRDALFRLVTGLLRRCRTHVHWGLTELGETGSDGAGDLLDAVNRLLRRLTPPDRPDTAPADEGTAP